MDVSTLEQFLTALEASKLLDAEPLAKAQQMVADCDNAESAARLLAREGVLTRWQAGQILVGRTSFYLGKYKLLDLLGRGGMGSVFLGQHVTMNRRVALKAIARELGRDPSARERFLAEARSAASLDHPNIVRVFSLDMESERYYLVMEYVDGRDLQQIVEEDGPLDYATAASMIRQAAAGLAHAHAQNMIHCDIKPSNLLVSTQGTVKILDMGLARITDADGTHTSSDDRMQGTVDYMSPEQGLGGKFDSRADIYSLGCTLYFLLTGHPPFPEGTLAQRIVKHQTQQPQNILVQRPDAPRDLVKICRKMMAKDPDDRYQSAEEISLLLTDWKPSAPSLKRAVAIPEDVPAEDADATDASTQRDASDSGIEKDASRSSAIRRSAALPVDPAKRKQQLIVGAVMAGTVLLLVAMAVAIVLPRFRDSSKQSSTSEPREVATAVKTAPEAAAKPEQAKPEQDATKEPPSPDAKPAAPAEKPAAETPAPKPEETPKPAEPAKPAKNVKTVEKGKAQPPKADASKPKPGTPEADAEKKKTEDEKNKKQAETAAKKKAEAEKKPGADKKTSAEKPSATPAKPATPEKKPEAPKPKVPEPPPGSVVQDDDGSILLTAETAKINLASSTSKSYKKMDVIHDSIKKTTAIGPWQSSADTVGWDIFVKKPGAFEITVSTSMRNRGTNIYTVNVDKLSVTGRAESTGAFTKYSVQRFSTKLRLDKPGPYHLEIKPNPNVAWAPLNLQSVELTLSRPSGK